MLVDCEDAERPEGHPRKKRERSSKSSKKKPRRGRRRGAQSRKERQKITQNLAKPTKSRKKKMTMGKRILRLPMSKKRKRIQLEDFSVQKRRSRRRRPRAVHSRATKKERVISQSNHLGRGFVLARGGTIKGTGAKHSWARAKH